MEVLTFRRDHHLSDWPSCVVEMRCMGCRRISVAPIALLLAGGDCTFAALVGRLKCNACGARPAPVYLCSGHDRQRCKGISPSWAVEIIGPPE